MSADKQNLIHPLKERRTLRNHVLVIHGGAGTMSKERSTPEQQTAYRAVLRQSLEAGYDILRKGGEAMDAAVAAVTVMEDSPLFNAGKGAVFNIDGKNELEASIMLSKPPQSQFGVSFSRRGIGLSLLTRVKNPSHLARALYLRDAMAPHAFLSGTAAESLAESLGEELVDPAYFFTEARWREHRRGLGLPETPLPGHDVSAENLSSMPLPLDQMPTGTVGAVALDVNGCIATVTSTGGRTNKLVGRIGDTPMMGSGYWAEEWKCSQGWLLKARNFITGAHVQNQAVGVSGTGDGDYFIRQSTASTIARRIRYLHEPLDKAASHVVEDLRKDGGIGGVIALDSAGNVAMPLNCPGMYRGVIRPDGVPQTAIFADDILS